MTVWSRKNKKNTYDRKTKSKCFALQIFKIKVAQEYAIIDLKPPNISKNYAVVKDMTVAVLSLINQAAKLVKTWHHYQLDVSAM